jgi:hypothetical protein
MFPERTWLRLLAVAVGVGLVGGALLGWATLVLSNTDIGGPGWSLRGNGALIVEFAAGPALLAGVWIWLVRRRIGPAVLAATLTLLIELGAGFGPILAGPSPGSRLPVLVGVVPAAVALGVGVALVWPPDRQAVVLAVAIFLLATALSLSAPFLVFILAPLLLPLVVVMPSFARYARRDHMPGLVALPMALVAGTIGAQRLVSPG